MCSAEVAPAAGLFPLLSLQASVMKELGACMMSMERRRDMVYTERTHWTSADLAALPDDGYHLSW